MGKNNGDGIIKLFLLILVLTQGSWILLGIQYPESLNDWIYIGLHSNITGTSIILFAIFLGVLKVANNGEFNNLELGVSLILGISSCIGSVSLGHAWLTDIVGYQNWHGEATSLEYTPKYGIQSCNDDNVCTCHYYGPYYKIVTNIKCYCGGLHENSDFKVSVTKEQFTKILTDWYGDEYVRDGGYFSDDFKTSDWRKGRKVGEYACKKSTIVYKDKPDGEEFRIPVATQQPYVNYLRESRAVRGKTVAKKELLDRVPNYPQPFPSLQGYGNIDINLVLFDQKMTVEPWLQNWADSVNHLLRLRLRDADQLAHHHDPFVLITDYGIGLSGTAQAKWKGLQSNNVGILLTVRDRILNEFLVMTLTYNQFFKSSLEYDLSSYIEDRLLPAQKFVDIYFRNLSADGEYGHATVSQEKMRMFLRDIDLGWGKRLLILLIAVIFMTPLLLFFNFN